MIKIKVPVNAETIANIKKDLVDGKIGIPTSQFLSNIVRITANKSCDLLDEAEELFDSIGLEEIKE